MSNDLFALVEADLAKWNSRAASPGFPRHDPPAGGMGNPCGSGRSPGSPGSPGTKERSLGKSKLDDVRSPDEGDEDAEHGTAREGGRARISYFKRGKPGEPGERLLPQAQNIPPEMILAGGMPGESNIHLDAWLYGLDLDNPPGDCPLPTWHRFIDNARIIVAEWADTALALGWSDLDLFGCHPAKPYARLDHAGLAWVIGRGRVVAIAADTAVIAMPSGSRLIYRRTPIKPRTVMPTTAARPTGAANP